jgi:hypothetical protein
MRILQLSLATIAASTAFASTAALAGPSLTGIDSTRIQGTALFNTSYGESFSVEGTTSAALTPFAVTTGLTGMGAPTAGSLPTNVGNVGTAVLAVSYLDDNGTTIDGSVTTAQQVQATSGIIALGGSTTIGGMMAFNVPSSIILDQTDLTALSIGAGDNVGAAITGTQVGTSSLTGDVSVVNQVINSLSLSAF